MRWSILFELIDKMYQLYEKFFLIKSILELLKYSDGKLISVLFIKSNPNSKNQH